MDLFLEIWASSFYLLNKVLLSVAENKPAETKRDLKILGWIVYILGVPGWVIILLDNHNWLAAAIELGGLPAMFLGLRGALRNESHQGNKLQSLVSFLTYGFLVFGVSYSIFDNKGITSASQCLEFGVTVGFLVGGYLLAKNDSRGWLFFVLMHLSMGTLMLIQNKPILAAQQAVSLCFGAFGLLSVFKYLRKKTLSPRKAIP